MERARTALEYFLPGVGIARLEPVPGGHVNRSFRVQSATGDAYLLQRLSPVAFPRPERIMANLERVTAHLAASIGKRRDEGMRVPALHAGPDGSHRFIDAGGGCWRLQDWIAHGRALRQPPGPDQAREMGRLLGRFHLYLADLDPGLLHDPLPGFHHTPTCLAACVEAVAAHELTGWREQECAGFVDRFAGMASRLEENRSRLTKIIIHGDPKVGNFLFDSNGGHALALIDLDTVMEGLLLHDLGDALRSCCNPAGEEADPDEVFFDPRLLAAFMEGYFASAEELPSSADLELLVEAPQVIAFELGLRFFTDHLNGNTYFRATRPDQNLDRALVQFHLAASIEEQRRNLESLISISGIHFS